ncbi:hypothetical protein [Pseudoalteromonas marina]|uniref:Uncharacterized protein n=1 Tax=Pseudoalteromonas marina TaxID=267375 RepID=A0ABT9FI22_9GAMM|nr:hypothetical protein [Pseudoalteromonas marina]MDP2566442.1 hypothetical protein [Pseudoalteromonas marina]
MGDTAKYRYIYEQKNSLKIQVTSTCGTTTISDEIASDSNEETIKSCIKKALHKAGYSAKEIDYKIQRLKKSDKRLVTRAKSSNITGLLGVTIKVNSASVSFRGGYEGNMSQSYTVIIRDYSPGVCWIKRSELDNALKKAIDEAEISRGTQRTINELKSNTTYERIAAHVSDKHKEKFKQKNINNLYILESIHEIAELHTKRVVPKDTVQLNKWLETIKTDRESLVEELRENNLTEKNIRRVLEGKKVLADVKNKMRPNKFGYKDVSGSPLKDRICYKYLYGTGANSNYALLNEYIDDVYYVLEDDLKKAFVAACKERDIAAGELVKTEQEYAQFYKHLDWENEYRLRRVTKNVHVTKSLENFERDVLIRIPDHVGAKAQSRLSKKAHRENKSGYIGSLLIASHEYIYYQSSVYKNGNTKKGTRFGVALNEVGQSTRWLEEAALKQAYLSACKEYDLIKGLELLEDEEYLHVYKEVDWLEVLKTKCTGSKITRIVVAKNISDAKQKLSK